MSALLWPALGLAALHLLGAGLVGLATRGGVRAALASPSAALVGLAAAHAVSLGTGGLPLGLGLALSAWLARPTPGAPLPGRAWAALAALAVVVLARPWAPTMWDELVWLGKARLESLGFGEGVRAALDPAQRLVPPGYPPLWPAAVGWLSLGHDALEAQVVAGSLLVLLAAAAALEAWWPAARPGASRAPWVALAVVLAAPLALVHLRSVYLDLPVGLLAVALLGHLVRAAERPEGGLAPAALAVAVVLPALKDEGLAHALAAAGAVLLVAFRRPGAWRRLLPAALALASTGTWRALAQLHGVQPVDHALASPYWPWAPVLLELLGKHAADVWTWGLFWPVALAALVAGRREGPGDGALRAMLALALGLLSLALLTGPERVRVFAENGTLLNRMLVQLWPAAALVVLRALAPRQLESA